MEKKSAEELRKEFETESGYAAWYFKPSGDMSYPERKYADWLEQKLLSRPGPSVGYSDGDMKVLNDCRNYLLDLDAENIHDPSVGIFKDENLHPTIDSLTKIMERFPAAEPKEMPSHAIGFAEWILKDAWHKDSSMWQRWIRRDEKGYAQFAMTAELYTRYIATLTKQGSEEEGRGV